MKRDTNGQGVRRSINRWWPLLVTVTFVGAIVWFGLSGALKRVALTFQPDFEPALVALITFAFGSVIIMWGTWAWLERIDHHALLRSDERLQNKDALSIGTFFALMMLLGLCVTGAAAASQFKENASAAVQLALAWALASAAVGAAFGFLLGHPRRLFEDKTGKEERTTLSGLLRTGLDDMVDWLVKGLTTVLLVNSTMILEHLATISNGFARGLLTGAPNPDLAAAASFAQPVIVFFTILGALAACLVTRTYLTGALTRADRSTTGAFNRVGLELGEVLMLQAAQRSLTTQEVELTAEIRAVAKKLACLSLQDLRSPQEFAMWAKANSMLGNITEALAGYEKAARQSECDPALLLDYGVTLHLAGDETGALLRLEQAFEHLSAATPDITRKNIVKSLTFQLLYQPSGFDRVIQLIDDYYQNPRALESGGLRVNEACARGQKFYAEALKRNLLALDSEGKPAKPIKISGGPPWSGDDPELDQAYQAALAAVKTAVKHDSRWKERLRLLLLSAHPGKKAEPGMTDLEIFERFDEFRLVLDLPPFSEGDPPTPPVSDKPRSDQGSSGGDHVATEQSPQRPINLGTGAGED